MSIVPSLGQPSSYRDKKYPLGLAQLEKDLLTSSTLYVGNLSFYTTEEQVVEVFGKVGEVKRVIMGLDRVRKTPCGFCFVEYYRRDDCLAAQMFINETKVDERIIRTDVDPGFKPGRQFGRGKTGGQVRDEHREDYDEGRGGWGARVQELEDRAQRAEDVYGGDNIVPRGSHGYSSYYSQPKASYSSHGKRGRDLDEEEPDERRFNRFRNE